jgi:threonine 3-dehydrogenase
MRSLAKLKREPGIWLYDAPTLSAKDLKASEVLIKITKTSICGTDVHIDHWDEWAQKTIPVPMVVGHEYAGTIAALGNEVKELQVGQRVSGEGHIACGFCRNCRAGRRHLCRKTIGVGVTRPGCFAEYLIIPADNVCPLPDDITDDQAAIFDPLGNAVHVALSFDVVGEDVLIMGAGPIGIMAAVIARHIGARHIVITDINDYRLELAKKMGVTHAINTNRESVDGVMKQLKMTEGFDIGFEMSGNPGAFNLLLQKMNNAGKVALLGFLPNSTTINWNDIIMKGLIVKGIYGREMFDTWYKMISMLQSGLDIDAMITHRYPAAEFQKGFYAMSSGQCGKVVLDWTK